MLWCRQEMMQPQNTTMWPIAHLYYNALAVLRILCALQLEYSELASHARTRLSLAVDNCITLCGRRRVQTVLDSLKSWAGSVSLCSRNCCTSLFWRYDTNLVRRASLCVYVHRLLTRARTVCTQPAKLLPYLISTYPKADYKQRTVLLTVVGVLRDSVALIVVAVWRRVWLVAGVTLWPAIPTVLLTAHGERTNERTDQVRDICYL